MFAVYSRHIGGQLLKSYGRVYWEIRKCRNDVGHY